MDESAPPPTREQRQAAVAAWRALPAAVRRSVVTRARAGEAEPDRAAAEIGRRYALAVLSPRGPQWWRRWRWSPTWTWALVGVATLLLAAALWAYDAGVPGSELWGALLLAAVLLAWAAMDRSLRRSLRALAARPRTGPDDVSAARPPWG